MGAGDSVSTIKVLIAIPNMGYTQVEAYGNRLMNFMTMGNLQTEQRLFRDFYEVAKSINPEFADQAASKFIESKAQYVKKIGEDVFEFWFVNIGRIFTPAAREEAAKKAVENAMDYLFFIDDDMICPNDLFQKLYRHSHVADIVAPLAFTRNPPYKPVMYQSVEGWDASAKSDYFMNNTIMNYPRKKLVETDAVGFGAALIKTWIFNKLSKPWFMSSCGTGEDILFCYKAKKVGARVFMDTTFNIGHLGHPQVITEDFADNFRKTVDPKAEQRYPQLTKYDVLTVLGE